MIEKKIFRYNEWKFSQYLQNNSGTITEDWLRTVLSMTTSKPKNKHLFDEAARRGYLGIFTDHATERYKRLWDATTFVAAAENGHLDVLKFLRSQDPPCPWSSTTCSGGACSAAVRNGHFDVLKWLRSQDPPCPWGERTCSNAAFNGHLDVLKWLRSQDPPCPWGE